MGQKKFDRLEPGVVETTPAHARPENLDPKVNGPFLDDIRKAQEEAYREHRNSKDQHITVVNTPVDRQTGRNLGSGVPNERVESDEKSED